jgi:hypothetical protein
MRWWIYLLLIAAILLLPAGAMAGMFGTPETASVLQVPEQTVPPAPQPTPALLPKPGFAEYPATAPGARPVSAPPTAPSTLDTVPATTLTSLAPTTVPTTLPTTVPTTEAATTTPSTEPAVAAAAVPSVAWQLAHVRAAGVQVYPSPDAATPVLALDDHTEWGTPRVLPVLAQSGDWLQILLPVRPNNAVGWIRADSVDLTVLNDEIHVSLVNRVLELHHATDTEMIETVAVGAPASPTPPGIYYVTDIMPTSGAYGPWALALNGHSDTYMTFDGGDARLGIHGTNEPATIGQAASHGCVRVANDVVTVLAHRVQVGTPVIIS